MDLRSRIIRLAYQQPKHRKHLLPILKTSGWRMNAGSTPLDQAKSFAEDAFSEADKSLEEVWPDFDHNYKLLQQKLNKAKNIPRILMPVIEPGDMTDFSKSLNEGSINIFRPWAKGELFVPERFRSKSEGEEWIELGFLDGKEGDDTVRAKKGKKDVKSLIPTQSEIWFDKIVASTVKFGAVSSGSPVLNKTVIVSKEGYILDGHHRFASALLSDPSLALSALLIPMGIDLLLKIGKSYGEAIGNKPKA